MDKLTHFRIDYTDVILQDYEEGKGKIILSNDDRDINLSYYWGSMGKGYDLSKFILKTNDSYLIGKLGVRYDDGPINMKRTMANVRRHIKEETDWRWYMSPVDDRDLRQELNQIQSESYDVNSFITVMSGLDLHKYYSGSDIYSDGKSAFTDMIDSISSEPWYFIVRDEHPTNYWLSKFLQKLRSHLKTTHHEKK